MRRLKLFEFLPAFCQKTQIQISDINPFIMDELSEISESGCPTISAFQLPCHNTMHQLLLKRGHMSTFKTDQMTRPDFKADWIVNFIYCLIINTD